MHGLKYQKQYEARVPGSCQSVHPWKPQEQNKESQRLGMLVPIAGLHAYCLGLVSVNLGYPSPPPPWRDPPCSCQNGPFQDFPGVSVVKESACQCRRCRFNPQSGKIPHAAEQLCPCTTTTEPRVLEPMLPRDRALQQKRPPQWEACTLQPESSQRSNKDPVQPKMKINK